MQNDADLCKKSEVTKVTMIKIQTKQLILKIYFVTSKK